MKKILRVALPLLLLLGLYSSCTYVPAIEGRVVDQFQKPVKDAQVVAYFSIRHLTLPFFKYSQFEALPLIKRSNEDGQFSFRRRFVWTVPVFQLFSYSRGQVVYLSACHPFFNGQEGAALPGKPYTLQVFNVKAAIENQDKHLKDALLPFLTNYPGCGCTGYEDEFTQMCTTLKHYSIKAPAGKIRDLLRKGQLMDWICNCTS